jgi:hypothetical protein
MEVGMTLAITSTSAALTILTKEGSSHATSTHKERNSIEQFLDPNSIFRLPAQSLDALLRLRTELRGDRALQVQPSAPPASSAGARGQSGVLAWRNSAQQGTSSFLNWWIEETAARRARSTDPTKNALMPWNSPDIVQQLRDWDEHSDRFDERERAFLASDEAIYRSMARTPQQDVARLNAEGAEIWYNRSQFREVYSDKEFNRDVRNYVLYGLSLIDPIDPSSERSRAFLNNTAQIIRGSTIPKFHEEHVSYSMYKYNRESDHYKWFGGWDRSETNIDQVLAELRKKNPSLNVTYIDADNDVAFILYPKTASAQAVAQGSVAATDTKPAAEPAH